MTKEFKMKSLKRLTHDEMVHVKGGKDKVELAASFNLSSTSLSVSLTVNGCPTDDKRRERPGGGITTL